MPKVESIVQENVRTGTGAKGDWAKHKVLLDDGQEVYMFAPVEVGDEVESYENNGYTNWKVKDGSQKGSGGRKASSAEGNITTDQIYAVVCGHTKELEQLPHLVDLMTAIAHAVGLDPDNLPHKEAPKPKPKKSVDTMSVDDIIDSGEPINLDDIPF